jgi:acetyltransferase-like isoleucine patch superfamily enzyme
VSGLRRSMFGRALGDIGSRRYQRRAARLTGSGRLAALGENSIIQPPALIIGHEQIHIGRDVVVHAGAFFSVLAEYEGVRYDARLTIGDRVTLGFDVVIACAESVEIGDDVQSADRVFIADTYHEYRDVSLPAGNQGPAKPRPVTIGAGAFLGIGCAILPGVTLGEGAYVGANAVVTADVPARSVAVGNPARVVRQWDGTAWRSS